MRHITLLAVTWLLVGASTVAQSPEPQIVGNMSQLMMTMVYPPANEIFLTTARGGTIDNRGWTNLERSAVLLAESANVLMMRGHAVDQGRWMQESRRMGDAAVAALKAIRARDVAGLAATAEPINATCTSCHLTYRRNVHPNPNMNPALSPNNASGNRQ